MVAWGLLGVHNLDPSVINLKTLWEYSIVLTPFPFRASLLVTVRSRTLSQPPQRYNQNFLQ